MMKLLQIHDKLELMLVKEGYDVLVRDKAIFRIEWDAKSEIDYQGKLVYLLIGFSYALEQYQITTLSETSMFRKIKIVKRE